MFTFLTDQSPSVLMAIIKTSNMIGWTICLSHSGGPIRSVTESLGFLLAQGATSASRYPAARIGAFNINLFNVGSKVETRPTRKAFCSG